jgi:Zn-dependent M28 family amino/carboxypeptidase
MVFGASKATNPSKSRETLAPRSTATSGEDFMLPITRRALICATLICALLSPCSLPLLAQESIEGPKKERTAPSAPLEAAPLLPELRVALATITSDRVLDHVAVLSSPEFEGRAAGERGALLGARYVARGFRQAGLRPGGEGGGFYQAFSMSRGDVRAQLGVVTSSGLHSLRRGAEFTLTHLPQGDQEKLTLTGQVEWVGYGLRVPGFDSYRGRDLKGKIALAFVGSPLGVAGEEALLAAKARAAAEAGAIALLVTEDPTSWRRELEFQSQLRPLEGAFPSEVSIPVANVTLKAAARLGGVPSARLSQACLATRRTRRPVQGLHGSGQAARLLARVVRRGRYMRNVIGVLVGSDPKLRHEAVVIGAHHDHLGLDSEGLHPGANDNASGIAALLEIARALGSLPPARLPRRSVLLVAFDGEEIGRLGSTHYARHAPIGVARTRLMINFDMIGGNDPGQIWAVASRSSKVLHGLHQEANRHVGLELVHPKGLRLGRSDHTAFYRRQVPVLYFFGGLNEHYHTPQDTLDRVSCGKVARVAKLALLTAWEAANRVEPLPFHKPR